MSQTQCAVCIKRQSQSQLIVRSAVVMAVLLCGQEIGVSHNATTAIGWLGQGVALVEETTDGSVPNK